MLKFSGLFYFIDLQIKSQFNLIIRIREIMYRLDGIILKEIFERFASCQHEKDEHRR